MCDSTHAIAVGDRIPAVRQSRSLRGLCRQPSVAVRALSRYLPKYLASSAVAFALVTLSACGTPAPKDHSGSWTPVNRFHSATTEIPLSPAYTFYASPMDATLRTMLHRWAADTGLQLSYQWGSDFTLYLPVAKVRTNDLQVAVADLSAIYAPQGIAVTSDGKRILVQSTSVPPITPGPR